MFKDFIMPRATSRVGSRSRSRTRSRSRSRSLRTVSRSPSRSRTRSYSYSSRSRSRSYSPSRSRSLTHSRSRSRSPYQRRRASPPPLTKIIVEKLTKNVTVAHLTEIFGSFGHINHIDLPTNRKWNANRGIAYIEYASRAEAERAISYMDGGQLDGSELTCSLVPRRPSPPPPPRRRGSDQVVIELVGGLRFVEIHDLDLRESAIHILTALIALVVDPEHLIPEVAAEVILEAIPGADLELAAGLKVVVAIECYEISCFSSKLSYLFDSCCFANDDISTQYYGFSHSRLSY
ncbi:hypothetical protein G9A89_013291 [Geosiphon pyriformis]|nr:hypothetical protein G9A89_013291 [Geosiphon pyriformis]